MQLRKSFASCHANAWHKFQFLTIIKAYIIHTFMRKCKTFKKLPMKNQSVEMMTYHWQGSFLMKESAWLVFKNLTHPFPLLYLLSRVSGIPHLCYSCFDSVDVDLHFWFTFSWILKTGRPDMKRMMKMWLPLSGWTKSYIDYLSLLEKDFDAVLHSECFVENIDVSSCQVKFLSIRKASIKARQFFGEI